MYSVHVVTRPCRVYYGVWEVVFGYIGLRLRFHRVVSTLNGKGYTVGEGDTYSWYDIDDASNGDMLCCGCLNHRPCLCAVTLR